MDTVKNIISTDSNKKTNSTLLNIIQIFGIVFIGSVIVNFIVKL